MHATASHAPQRHPITVGEYVRMGATGVLGPEARVELIDGEIIDMPPIGAPHAGGVKRLNRVLSLGVGELAIVSTQDPIQLGDLSAPQPDLALLRPRDDFYAGAHPGPGDILLLIEVSDTTLAYDRETKLPLYARFQIPEVWLVDVVGRNLDIHRDPDGGRYTTQFRVRDLARVGVVTLPGLTLNLSGLFGPTSQP
jgi:Uma2 family endonuclease